MTSESGIEPCPHGHEQRSLGMVVVPVAEGNAPRWYVRCMDCSATGPRTGTRETAIAAWNRRHPPASREEGLSSVLDAYDAETAKVPLGHENRSRGASTYNWRRAIVAELRELIPTKPEAKESREVSDEIEVLRRLADGDALAYSRDGDNCWFTNGDRAWVAEATVIAMREKGYLRRSWAADDPWGTDGISDAGRAALQSKKPE
jgi:hypothetical protein